MRRMTRLLAATVAATAATSLLGACGGDDGDTAASAAALPARSVEVGEVTVEVTPTQLDDDGATFDVVFDTHSVELDLDVTANATLLVDGVDWPDPAWDGDEPGGHHREGTLRFSAGGEANNRAILRIDGLDEPVEATWTLEGG